MKSEKKAIEFTKEQFETLLKVVYLGNWMVNACRDGTPQDPRLGEYENIENYIFSLAPKFDLGKYVGHEESDGESYYPTRTFEEETDVHKFHEEYDENTFWDELQERLGERDFYEKYGQEKIKNMTHDEWLGKLSDYIDAWGEELENFGLERLMVRRDL